MRCIWPKASGNCAQETVDPHVGLIRVDGQRLHACRQCLPGLRLGLCLAGNLARQLAAEPAPVRPARAGRTASKTARSALPPPPPESRSRSRAWPRPCPAGTASAATRGPRLPSASPLVDPDLGLGLGPGIGGLDSGLDWVSSVCPFRDLGPVPHGARPRAPAPAVAAAASPVTVHVGRPFPSASGTKRAGAQPAGASCLVSIRRSPCHGKAPARAATFTCYSPPRSLRSLAQYSSRFLISRSKPRSSGS